MLAASAVGFSPVDRQDEVPRVAERRLYSDDPVGRYDYDDDHDDENDVDDEDDDDDGVNDEETMLLLKDLTGSSHPNLSHLRY